MSARRALVLFVRLDELCAVLRGDKRVLNIPPAAEIVAASQVAGGIGVRIHHESFAAAPHGEPLPVRVAVTASSPRKVLSLRRSTPPLELQRSV